MAPPAPALFSTTIVPPRCGAAYFTHSRPMMSTSPPGGNGTTRRMGLSGNLPWALAGRMPSPAAASPAAALVPNARKVRFFMRAIIEAQRLTLSGLACVQSSGAKQQRRTAMPALRLFILSLLCLVVLPAGATASKGTLRPFASEAELKALLVSWANRYPTRRAEQMLGSLETAPPPAPAAQAASVSAAGSLTKLPDARGAEGGIVNGHG